METNESFATRLNTITPDRRREEFVSMGYSECKPLYFDESGNKTSDITKASKLPNGQLHVCGFSDSEFIPHSCYSDNNPISFNPDDSTSRFRAMESRVNMDKVTSSPTIYDEPLDALQNANNSANAMLNKINNENK